MKTQKLLNALAVLVVLSLCGFSLADSVTQTNTVYSRTDADSVDEQRLLSVHFIDVGGGEPPWRDEGHDLPLDRQKELSFP